MWLIGWQDYLLTIWPAAWLAGAAGVFLFYVQHQFEDVYWVSADCWSYDDAAPARQLAPEASQGPAVLHRQTSACTTCTTSARGFPTTTSSARTMTLRSFTRSRPLTLPSALGTVPAEAVGCRERPAS